MKKFFVICTTLLCLAACSSNNSTQVSDTATAEKQSEKSTSTAEASGKQLNELYANDISLADGKITLSNEAAKYPVVIDFSATWCPPCQQLVPMFHEWENTYGDKVIFLAIDVDQYPELTDSFGISSIPYIVTFAADSSSSSRVLTPDSKKEEIVGLEPDNILNAIKAIASSEK